MRIIDLLKKDSIDLGVGSISKSEALDHLIDLMEKGGNLKDKAAYKAAVLERESQGSTGIGEGIAIPHAKTAAVSAPGLAAMVAKEGIEFDSLDGEPANLFFLIAAPEGGANVHLEVLSRLSRMLIDDTFRQHLLDATTTDEFMSIIDAAEREKEAHETASETVVTEGSEKPFIVAVTACPTGIAHTYMAAESLEGQAEVMGVDIKVETNGSGGAKNVLTQGEIERAIGVIVAADKDVAMQRFNGKQVLVEKVSAGIKEPGRLIQTVLDGNAPRFVAKAGGEESESSMDESIGRQIYKSLMNGVSHMLPFVIGGGIMIALAFLSDMANAGAANFGSGSDMAAFLLNVGKTAFGMMMPILAGYIAMGIGERPALMPGIVGGLLAGVGGSGFFGALLAGFIAGYMIRLFNKVFKGLPKSLEGTKPVLIYPVLGVLLIGAIMIYVINPPTKIFNDWLLMSLESMNTSSKVFLGLIVGGMMSIDFGGPINKAAYVFGTASLVNAAGQAVASPIMAAVMAGGMVPPVAIAISMLLFGNRYTKKERESTLTTGIMGLSFITEGAIPFAAADPARVIPACSIGAATAGALSMWFGCASPAPHGGIFVVALIANWPMYLAAVAIGAIVAAVILGVIKPKKMEA